MGERAEDVLVMYMEAMVKAGIGIVPILNTESVDYRWLLQTQDKLMNATRPKIWRFGGIIDDRNKQIPEAGLLKAVMLVKSLTGPVEVPRYSL
jgi:hypothetical protein